MHLRNLVNLHLWWMALLTGSTVYFLFCAVAFVFKVFQTEVSFLLNEQINVQLLFTENMSSSSSFFQRIEFPVDSPFEQEDCRSLKAAIIASDLPILQHLGYLDLSLAAKHSPLRRRDIFAISQPGGEYFLNYNKDMIFKINELLPRDFIFYRRASPPLEFCCE